MAILLDSCIPYAICSRSMEDYDRVKAMAFQAEYIRRRPSTPKLTDEEFESLRPHWNAYQAEKARERAAKLRAGAAAQ